jgi:hypothetical protein
MHNVKIIRMQTGEDIMASMIGEEEAETVLLEDPMRLIFRRMPTGQTMLMMLPWLPVELIKDNSALIYNSDIITIIDPKESMIQYYDNLVMKTLLEMEKSEEMIEQLLKDQEDENEEAEKLYRRINSIHRRYKEQNATLKR